MASKGAADEDEAASAGFMAHAAKGRLVSSMMKKYLAEAMVPMLLELKRALEAARHPLLGQLLATLRALLKEHKHEVRLSDSNVHAGTIDGRYARAAQWYLVDSGAAGA